MNRKKKNICILCTVALLQGLVFYSSVATLYRQAQGVTVFHITIIESISLLLALALEVPWGYLADKIGYRKTIVICSFLFFLSKIVFWQADGFGMFLLERIMLSVVLSGLSGCDSAFLYCCVEKDAVQKTFGIYGAMGMIGLTVSSVIFSLFIKTDFKLAGFLTVIVYGLAAVLSLFLTEVGKDEKRADTPPFAGLTLVKEVFKDKKFLLLLAGAALLSETDQTIVTFLSQLQYVESGISVAQLGFIGAGVTLVSLLSAFVYRLTGRLGEHTTVKLLFLTAGGACLLLTLFHNPITSIAGIVLLHLSALAFVPIRADIQNRQITTVNRATVLSVYSMLMNSVAILLNLLFGRVSDINIRIPMGMGAGFCLIGFCLYLLWRRADKRVKSR